MPFAQQEFLRNAALALDLTQQELAARMHAPWTTFKKWMHPSESDNYREMPAIAWQLVREILQHEELKRASPKLKEGNREDRTSDGPGLSRSPPKPWPKY